MSIFSRKKKNKLEHEAKDALKKGATFVPVEEVIKLKNEIANLNQHIQSLVQKNMDLADRLED